MTPSERRAVAGLASVASVRLLGLFMLLPVLALYANQLKGATPFLVGLSVGAYGITQAFLQIPFGVASDRFGRRPVLLVGLAIFAFGGVVAATADHIGWVIIGRVMQGAGAVSAVLNALLADLTRDEVRTRAQAIFGASIGVSFMLSLMLGPLLADWLGVSGVFWCTVVLATAAFTGVAILAPQQTSTPVRSGAGGWTAVLADQRLRPLFGGIFVLHFLIAAAFVVLPFVLRDRVGLAPERHATLYLVTMLVAVIIAVALIGQVERHRAPHRFVAFAVACLVLSQVLFVLGGPSQVLVAAGLVLMFTGINFLEARLPAEVTLTATADRRGAALGVYASAQFVGIFAGGMVAGALLGQFAPEAVFAALGGMTALWLVVRLVQPAATRQGH